MRFYTYVTMETEHICVSFDGGKHLYFLSDLGFHFKDMNQLIEEIRKDQMEQLKNISHNLSDFPAADISSMKLCSPIVHPKQDIICLGINYRELAVEAGNFSQEAFGGERTYMPYFSKRIYRASAHGDPIPSYPSLVDSLDYEAELAVIIGRDCKGASKANAVDYIFGYSIMNDVSARNLQTRHKQWLLGKSLDGFAPMGPCIVTPDELGDVQNLPIRCKVNGDIRQNSNTKYMIQDVAGAIEELSAAMTLKAGTIIATGTPAGVGMGMNPPCFLQHGDVVTCEIEGIGKLTNIVD